MIGIYKITNTFNNKIYIGQSKDVKERKAQHFNKLRANKHSNKNMQADYNQYGQFFTFEVIERCRLERLNEREQYWIAYYNSNDAAKGYNLNEGGGVKRRVKRRGLLDRMTD